MASDDAISTSSLPAAAPGSSCPAPALRRQTWSDWARSPRGRIALTLMLIVVIACVAFWSPRRGLLMVKLAGARIELIHPLEHRAAARSLPFGWSPPVRTFLGRNNQRLNWLGTDDDVGLVGLGNTLMPDYLLGQLQQFPNARTLMLTGSPSTSLPAAVKSIRLERIFINAQGEAISLDGINSIQSLQELKLSNVTSLEMSDETLATLNRLHRLDFYAAKLTPDAFRQLARMQDFAGTLAFHRCSGVDAQAIGRLAGLTRLVRLELDYCPHIGDAEIEALKQMSHLRFLELRDTEAAADATDLQASLPGCRIDWRGSSSVIVE